MSALDKLHAKLVRDLGAGLDGPVAWKPKPLPTGGALLAEMKAFAAASDKNVQLLAERDREIVRMRNELALERGRRVVSQTPEAAAARAERYPIDVIPHYDRAHWLRGFTMKSTRQTLDVEVIRDGAMKPLLLRVTPQ